MATPLEIGNDQKILLDNEYRKEEEENFSYAMQLVFSSVLPMSLQSAFELGVFDIIAKAGEGARLSPAEIAAQMPANNPEAPAMLDRILRVLASHSILRCSVVGENGEKDESNFHRPYSLNPVSKYFVTNEDGVSLGPLLALVQDKIFLESCYRLVDSLVHCDLIPFSS
ncbi:hypothetical protein TIFTF001_045388 [Ficus carica]|uniref:O-methyltransferase dimerisation domain-containing protein n=1 Tax=Ficus carica TaxID=3494 RepID=A0AA88CK72_FICCA|nr:hypothetical protein TIFTF001_045381 [Ficus carica]GMN20828.1 hypothetical protein TIFTF001_045388 [Ficus carica]